MRIRGNSGEITVRWGTGGDEVVIEHPRPVRSVAYVEDPPSVVIVEEIPNGVPSDAPIHNAVVYGLGGAERLRLAPPAPPQGWMYEGFDQSDVH